VPPGCRTDEVCGDNVEIADEDVFLDSDCNQTVDEACTCRPGDVRRCFAGPPGRIGVGACVPGRQTCEGRAGEEFGTWGPCLGGISPGPETCDGLDNDCNGCADDGLCCSGRIRCPAPGDARVPDAQPFETYPLRGDLFYGGPAASWRWEVQGGPCDRLLAPTGRQSFTLEGENRRDASVQFTLSGDYTVTLTVRTPEGDVLTCTFIVHVTGPGLRIELCWDTTGSTDIDLHLHRPGTDSPWFGTDAFSGINPDDCYYYNCKAGGGGVVAEPDWGYGDSPLAACENGPEGDQWVDRGSCRNPRLDIDNISEVGIPENINVDAPRAGETFRVMVHFYGGGGETHPLINIYCNGSLRGTYGQRPDVLTGFTFGGSWGAGPMWRVADVTWAGAGCDLTPLHPPGEASGYWMTINDRSY
jgi:hypothetical protein